jgi:tRNA dimethylallyltransferase
MVYRSCSEKIPLVIVVGPTAVGKSDFAVSLAERVNGVIINGDMAQMYEPLTIGTAKPEWRNERVPHVLFDSITEPRDSSASEFRNKSERAMLDALESRQVPIIVGGSLFHISTLFFQLKDSSQQPLGCSTLQAPERTNSNGDAGMSLWNRLFSIDPSRASAIHPHDAYRLHRALRISETRVSSQCQPSFLPIRSNCIVVHVTRNREELYERINARVASMIGCDWMGEVRSLDTSWRNWLLKKKIIGYDVLIHALETSGSLSDIDIGTIQQKTRNYAKRQLTFWRSLIKKLYAEGFNTIVECDLTLLPVDLYLEEISTSILKETGNGLF